MSTISEYSELNIGIPKKNLFKEKIASRLTKCSPQATLQHMEVYVLYSELTKREKRDLRQFFLFGLDDIDSHLAENPVFLNKEGALHYYRFIGNCSAILRAYVPEMAVEGCSHGLSLRKGFITKGHIHSCLIHYCKEIHCYENPDFDHKYLPYN